MTSTRPYRTWSAPANRRLTAVPRPGAEEVGVLAQAITGGRAQMVRPATVLSLQQTAGNAATARWLSGCPARSPGEPVVQRYVIDVPASDAPGQQVVDRFLKAFLAKGGPGRGHFQTDGGDGLPEIQSAEKVHVIGHGSTTTLGGEDAGSVAARLVRMGLPTSYVGVVNLIACHSGERRLFGLASFAAQLQQALERRERKVLVKGLKGAGIVDRWGHVRVKTNEDTFNQLMVMEVATLERKRVRALKSSQSEEAKAQAIEDAVRAFDRRYQLLVDTYAPRHERKIVVGAGGRVVKET